MTCFLGYLQKLQLGYPEKFYNFYINELNITVQLSVEVLFHDAINPQRRRQVSVKQCVMQQEFVVIGT